ATVLAAAGLRRLDRLTGLDLPHEVLDPSVMLPAAGQGALAVEIAAAARPGVRESVSRLNDPRTRARVGAEREFLRVLEAGCLAPVGVLATVSSADDNGQDLTLRAVIGRNLSSTFVSGADSAGLLAVEGVAAADQAVDLGA